jgi:predicted glutamine amidotransferase
MCELLGLAFNEPVSPTLSFREFRHRCINNPDGWGLAFYPDEAAQIIKEPVRLSDSSLFEFIKGYPQIKSKIILSHVRKASRGNISYKNTHPFGRELFHREMTFAHNGTLQGYKNLSTGRFSPIGDTDSEYIFCYLLNCISEEFNDFSWAPETLSWLHQKFSEINRLGHFNCLMSDGSYLFCYHDIEHYNGLAFIRRSAPFNKVRLSDEDYEIDLTEEKSSTQRGYIVATRKLTDEPWESLADGELLVIANGDVVFSSHRNYRNQSRPDDK